MSIAHSYARGDDHGSIALTEDLLLVENYAANLRAHAHTGSWSDGGGGPAVVEVAPKTGVVTGDRNVANDGAWRHGVRFEPLGNIGGLWQSDAPNTHGKPGGFERYPASPRYTQTALWLPIPHTHAVPC